MASVLGLYIYPIKSCGGVALDRAIITSQGLGVWQKDRGCAVALDRQWCICDDRGFVQDIRVQPKLATLKVELVEEGSFAVRLSEATHSEGVEPLVLPVAEDWYTGSEHPDVVVSDRYKSLWFGKPLVGMKCAGPTAARWITSFIHKHNSAAKEDQFRIVRFMPDGARGKSIPQRLMRESFRGKSDIAKRAHPNDTAAFADCAPYHLVSSSSLDDLSQRTTESSGIEMPVSFTRFRPNIIVQGMMPYEEDNCWTLKIGASQFRQLGPTGRCVIPTTDPKTGTRDENEQPRATLMDYRPLPYGDGPHGGPTFGIWLAPDDVGVEIAVASEVRPIRSSQL